MIKKDKSSLLEREESLDDLQIRGRHIIQKNSGFRYGIDAVLLSDYARIKKEGRLMDLCTGTGVIAILAEAKYPLTYVEGLEYQEEYAGMAQRSVLWNDLSHKIRIVQGDVRRVREDYQSGSFDYVTCNPPYMVGSHGLGNRDEAKRIARHEITCTLYDVVRAAAWLLKEGGHFYMVHRPFRLAEIMDKLRKGGLEPKRMCLVYPYVNKEPNMVLIDAVKGGRERITVDPPFIVYNQDGSYTDQLLDVYGR